MTMTTQTITDVRRVGGRLGAEVLGLDLREDLPAPVFDEINEALLEHKALFFRGQQLTDEHQVRFVERFGPLTGAHPTLDALDGQPSVLPVRGEQGVRANAWHTDVTFVVSPPKLSTLRSLTVPPYGGDTLIADTAAAYRDLPPALRDLANALWAVHTNDYDYVQRQFYNEAAAAEHAQFVSRRYETAHPVVRVHPETGHPNLFIGGFAQRLIGLSPSEGRDILRLLQAYVIRPENTVRWRWAPGDLILFDNRTTQHYAPDDYGDLARELHRVTAAGDVPVGIDGARSYALSGDDASHYTPVPA
jgi:alpha-ketoglutarate-dependent taurine dioxygenase